MHDHRAGHRGGWSNQQRPEILVDPGERTPVGLFRACEIVEDADRRHGVVGRIDYIIGHEAFDIADNRNGALLDPAGQLFGHASPCLALTDGGVHESPPSPARLPEIATSGDHSSHTSGTNGASSRIPRAHNITPSGATAPSGATRRHLDRSKSPL